MSTKLLLSIFLAFFSSIAISNAAIADEVSALLSIKSELFDPLDALRDWRPLADAAASSHCNWTGVRCNWRGSVDGLDLSHMNLSGRITDEFRHLPSLAGLNICCNSFTSSLPRTLSNLTMLKELDVSDNNFVGHFPTGLGACPGLTSLNVSGNNFVGPLPDDIGNATSLESLDFRGSFFTGSIPPFYQNLQKLKFLGLSGNNLTGKLPAMLGLLSSLETLIIGYNGFEGPIPAELGNLTNLQYLDMAVGNLDGAVPAELGKLQSLTTVYLYKNDLGGEIPKEMGNLSSLVMLDLSDNLISGSIPPELAKLSNLQLLNLMCNQLKGPVPAGIGELPQLEVLALWNNSLSGPLPANLGCNSPLRWLDVSTNSLSGEIPAGLCSQGNLTKLILFNNAFSGPIPASLSACLSLVRVRIQNNRLNGTITSGLGKLPGLQRLELAGNELSGEVPEDIAFSTSLSFIDLSHNHLQLSLPSNILSLPTLQSFMASDNELTGEIPDEFQDCPSLSSLDLSNNRLSGSIPGSLASCKRLVTLNLRSNRLTGEIPAAIAMMSTLAMLDLSNNYLTGSIPSNFGSSPALEMVNLAYNNLSGPVPSNGLLRTINPDELAGNPGLCGGVLTPCAANSPGASASMRRRGSHFKHIVAGWLIGISAVLAIGIAVLGAHQFYKRWYNDEGCCDERFDVETGAWPWRLTAFQRLNFTSADVLASIKESNIIGMGGTGIVYKAEIPRHHGVVAVKKLWRGGAAEAGDESGAGDLVGEVSLLGRLRHRNVVRMLGYLHNDTEAMIVYEYMPHGSLWEALHGRQAGRVLMDWVSRYNVAAGIAQGLAYLHHDCHPPVIHRDVKSSNVLLDANLEARIADFGLARIMVRKNETVSTVAGSYGYIAPEYGYTLKVDQKSDIYSFGVVLMELLTGKRPIEPEFGDCLDIVGWVRERLRSNRGVDELLDASIGGQCEHVREEMLLVLRIAVLCTARSPKDRPSMRDVLTMLGEAKPRRKSSSTGVGSNGVAKDKPVFTTSPDPGFL
ncbi:uncharacterized protein [Elaeis guineensis]|uniref:MDIS1-interacting receptor like kinase 1 n=1 Tax=Elaeis guineensis var. tenera TaxID=51953 RepID=A0A6I9R3B8_ELAGV|nr:MDIS1-interacting receptor like kinase 1 [Elaeis guineensis]